MNKFLELSFRNYCRNDKDGFTNEYEAVFEPFTTKLNKLLSKELCGELEELLGDCMTDAMCLAGVAGMQLAINVLDGTDKQPIE
jgi:NTP pyrophosphatase (non-canonical NTP hydrolase)